jgi:Mrp family chromosome partitioning ATPase
MHQGVALFGGFLTNETTRLRSELARTEEELRNAKMKVGIISVDDAKKAYTEEMSKIRQDLLSAQTELAGRQAILKALTKDAAGNLEVTNTETTAMMPDDQVNAYKGICMRLDVLENKEQEFLTQQGFTEENVLVKDVHGQITELQKQKKALEDKNPKLASLRIPVSISNGKDSGTLIDLPTEYAEVAAVKSRIESLNSQSSQIWAEVTNFEKAEGTILELQQKRDLEQADLKYFAGTLEQNQINDALGVDKASNISIIQSPSTPIKAWSKAFKKKVAMVAVGGVVFGLALAFLMEMFIDRSVRRPSEIETKLRLPLFISIPNIGRNGHSQRLQSSVGKHLQLNDAASNGSALTISNASTGNVIPPWDRAHFLRPFYEGLRDRLIVHFEVRNLTHKPKMVAVTSCNKGAGVSSIAAGMAASLSETGDGNVLLVNMSGKQGAAQQFHKGDPSCDLDEALEVDTMKGALIGGNLYAATERADEKNPPSALPKRLRGLMPKLKASDYDYIIFDLPPVNQTSVTARLSGYMDMVLLVIESEKTNQDVVQRVNKLLEESKANVSTVLNKVRTYVPTQLHQEYLGDV